MLGGGSYLGARDQRPANTLLAGGRPSVTGCQRAATQPPTLPRSPAAVDAAPAAVAAIPPARHMSIHSSVGSVVLSFVRPFVHSFTQSH
jgi:hypothetical protein